MIIGDYLYLTDVGFALLMLFFGALFGILVWQAIGLWRDWRRWEEYQREEEEKEKCRR